MKKSVLLGLMASCALVLGACGGGGGKGTADSDAKDSSGKSGGKQEFRLVSSQELPSADLSLATDEPSHVALNTCYEGIYRMDKDQKLQPAGASEMAEVSEDGLTYKIKLNKDSKWSNGDPVTAKDYVYGWQRTVDPKTAAEYAYLFAPIKNANDIMEGKVDVSELGIKAIDDYTLEIDLTTPTQYFDYLLAFPAFFPQNQSVVEKYGKEYALTSDNAVYNGPFKLADFDGPGSDTKWSYVKNDTYWDKKNVKLDKISVSVVKETSTALNMFEDGQVDDVALSGELAQQKANDPAYTTEMKGSTFYLQTNQAKADSVWRNKNLRKAVSYAINRKALVEKVIANGSPAAKGLVPKDLAFDSNGKDFSTQTTSKVSYDAKKAKDYWEKAKKELGVDSLEIEFLTEDTDNSKKMAEYLQGSIQDTLDGITVKVANVPFSVKIDRSHSGDFDMAMNGWGADYADPSSFMDLFTSDNSYNYGKWSNPEYDKLVKAASTTDANDPEKRWQDYIDAENIIVDECGVIPIYQKAEAHLISPKVKGIVNHASGVKREYKWVHIDD